MFIVVDHQKNFATLSIYNAGSSIYNTIIEKSEIQLINPILKQISFEREEEETIKYNNI